MIYLVGFIINYILLKLFITFNNHTVNQDSWFPIIVRVTCSLLWPLCMIGLAIYGISKVKPPKWL
jgi:hypothetical protein